MSESPQEARSFDEGLSEAEKVASQIRTQMERARAKLSALWAGDSDEDSREGA